MISNPCRSQLPSLSLVFIAPFEPVIHGQGFS